MHLNQFFRIKYANTAGTSTSGAASTNTSTSSTGTASDTGIGKEIQPKTSSTFSDILKNSYSNVDNLNNPYNYSPYGGGPGIYSSRRRYGRSGYSYGHPRYQQMGYDYSMGYSPFPTQQHAYMYPNMFGPMSYQSYSPSSLGTAGVAGAAIGASYGATPHWLSWFSPSSQPTKPLWFNPLSYSYSPWYGGYYNYGYQPMGYGYRHSGWGYY